MALLLTLALGACGDSSGQDVATRPDPEPTTTAAISTTDPTPETSAPTTAPTTTGTTPGTATPVDEEACRAEGRVLVAAIASYYSSNSSYGSESDLVTAGLLAEESAAFDVDGLDIATVAGGPCDDGSTTPADDGDLSTCDRQERRISHAVATHYEDTGEWATEAELVDLGYLREEVEEYEVADGVILPTPGGACD